MRPDERFPRKRTVSSGSRVPPAETSTRRPSSEPGRPGAAPSNSAIRAAIASGSDHPARTDLALGELALRRSDQLHAALAKQGGVRLGRRVLPHAHVHRRRDEDRSRMSERCLGEKIVREPVREPGERVGRQRRDDEEIRALEVRIRIVAS